MRTSSSESSGTASTVQPRGVPQDAEDGLTGPSTLRPISRPSRRAMEIAPGSQQRAEAMEEEMPIQLNTQVGVDSGTQVKRPGPWTPSGCIAHPFHHTWAGIVERTYLGAQDCILDSPQDILHLPRATRCDSWLIGIGNASGEDVQDLYREVTASQLCLWKGTHYEIWEYC